MLAIISLQDQDIHVFGTEGLLARSRVSTGARGYRTPTGVFSIIQKRRYHESNIYSGAPMPWMQRITWSGIALHGGVVPSYPASHGCIRLTYDFAPRLWAMTKIGGRVIVSWRGVAPVDITHPRLPGPSLTPMPENASADGRTAKPIAAEVEAGGPVQGSSDMLAARMNDASVVAVEARKPRAPLERARAAKRQAVADAKAAEAALRSARAAARAASAEAQRSLQIARKARAKAAAAERRLASASKAARAATRSETIERTAKAETAAQASLEAARAVLAEATALETAKARASTDAAERTTHARSLWERAAANVRDWAGGLDPISVFISRKEGRIFVRQGLAPLFDGEVTITDPDGSLGTHVFTAMAEEDDGARLRWSVVTVPDAGAGATAAEALARIEIPDHVGMEIADRLWVGASLIISDQGISGETGQGTDFVVLTKP